MPRVSHPSPAPLGPVDVTRIGLGVWQGHAGPMARPHRHDEIEINFIEGGSFTYLLGGRKAVVPPWRMSLFWAGIPHQLLAMSGRAPCNWVTVPLPWFLQWKLPDNFTQHAMRGELIVDGDATRRESDLALFKQWSADKNAVTPEHRAIFLLELEARLRRLALTSTIPEKSEKRRQSPSPVSRGGLSKVEQMAQFVAEHYTGSVRVADIAAVAGLHPNYAMNLFRKTFGVSLVDYATQHRISHAQRLLLTTDAKVLDIALESGFGSLSRFYAAFTEACGQSPREYRKSLRVRADLGPRRKSARRS
jgi:AraC-like DNA-binding protein